jgi:hypothetical protein
MEKFQKTILRLNTIEASNLVFRSILHEKKVFENQFLTIFEIIR